MEHLTKQQVILLAIFLSLFSAFLGSIITVALMDQNPGLVIQTITRVIK
ncbi:MAG TPA: hypothetical protein VFQ72_04400 [Candidatus Paceibacterota bacterium]|nr:hypothetical protein [Candidatus Paceibacterota bacterium]